jgi:biopolymer transport protein ExbB
MSAFWGEFTVTRILLAFLLVLGLATPAAAAGDQGWWNKDWSYRKSVTVDTSPTGINATGAIGRTVVLVRLHSGNFTFTDAMPNGADIRFVDTDNKTPLPFHIEHFDSGVGIATVWVAVPNLNGGEKHVIWLYFGNKTAPVGADEKATYDPDYMAVYHFAEGPGTASNDSSANANTAKSAPPGVDDGGIISRAARFPGQGPVQIAESGSLAMPAAAPFTFTAWVKPDNLAGIQAIFNRGALTVGLNAGVPFVTGPGVSLQAKTAVKQGDWSQVAFVTDGKDAHIYVNGIEQGTAPGALGAIAGPATIGGAPGQPFTGEIDEVRLSKTARPAGMIQAMADAESKGGKLVNVADTAEKQSSGGGVFFFVLSKLEGVDEVVVGVCLFMTLISALVMYNRFAYFSKCTKGNAAFMRQFRKMENDLVPSTQIQGLDKKEAKLIKSAPLAHIYDVGIEEFNRRKVRLGDRPLSSQAIESMRAAASEVVVHENHKLDAWMVLLTIAISGGPFIGLLGTVMGVMNTFGGVAMAGDVNVNAIAPGIAAALLATISGLFCAIPSLFGYNYLNSMLGPLASDMGIFIDQLLTRLAEMQADQAAEAAPHAYAGEAMSMMELDDF